MITHKENPVTNDELNEGLKTLDTKNSSGYDKISSYVIKHISPSFFEQIKYISNLSTENSFFLINQKLLKLLHCLKKAIMC